LIFLLLAGQPVVGRIEIKGAKGVSKDKLLKILALKKGSPYRASLLKSSLFKLRDYYKSRGYFNAQIGEPEVVEKRDRVYITIRITEGPRKTVTSLEISGNRKISSETIKKILGLKPPFSYDEEVFGEREYRLLSIYADSGYPYMELKREFEDLGDDTLRLIYHVREGPLVIVSGYKIEGLGRVRRKIVDREIVIKPGDPYNATLLIESKRRIYSTGLFSSVRHEIKELSPQGDTVLIVFVLEEIKPGFLNLGFGYHSPTDLQGKFALGHLNVFNNGQRAEFHASLLHDLKQFRRKRFEVHYSEPYFLGFRLEARGLAYYYQDVDEEVEEVGLDFQLRKVISKNFRINSSVGWTGVLKSPGEGRITINSAAIQPLWDTRDNLLDPNRGLFSTIRLEGAGWVLGGSYDFTRLFLDLSRYVPVKNEKIIAALRFRAGTESPFGRSHIVPSIERFTLGGDGSLRGYDRRSVGPPDPERDFRSGTKLLNFNLELRFRVWGKNGFVAFADAGGLYDRWEDLDFQSIALSAGAGLRLWTPVGPIRLDWGIKLRNRSPGDRGRLYLSIGHMY